MTKAFLNALVVLQILVCVSSAQQWRNCRCIEEEVYTIKGGAITLLAFDLIPRINTIPLDLKSVRRYSLSGISGDTTLCYTSIFFIDQVQGFIIDTLIHNNTSLMYPNGKYYLKNNAIVGYSHGESSERIDQYQQKMELMENGMAKEYTSSHKSGGDHYTTSDAKISYVVSGPGGTYDSLKCFFQHTSNRFGTNRVNALYGITYRPDNQIRSITGTSEYTYINKSGTPTVHFLKEQVEYSYDGQNRLIDITYAIVDTQTDTIFEKKNYQYTYCPFGILKEIYAKWIDSTTGYMIHAQAYHSYDIRGRVKTYTTHFYPADTHDVTIHEYWYDAQNRICKYQEIQKSGGWIQEWKYDTVTPLKSAPQAIKAPDNIRIRRDGKIITLISNQQSTAEVCAELYAFNGKKVKTLFTNRSTNSGMHTLTHRLDTGRLSAGIYFVTITTGNTRVSKPIIVN